LTDVLTVLAIAISISNYDYWRGKANLLHTSNSCGVVILPDQLARSLSHKKAIMQQHFRLVTPLMADSDRL